MPFLFRHTELPSFPRRILSYNAVMRFKENFTISAEEAAQRLVTKYVGTSPFMIIGVTPASDPKPGHLTFLKISSRQGVDAELAKLSGMVVVCQGDETSTYMPPPQGGVLCVADPYAGFLDILELFLMPEPREAGIHPSAVVHPSARIGAGVHIGPMCWIDAGAVVGEGATLISHVRVYADAHVGDGTTLHSGVSIRERCIVGANCILHDNVVIGADGFGYTPDPKRGLRKVPQVGHVEIGRGVEIGAGTCIDRGTLGATIIGSGTKIDNLVQIGHNTRVGSFCIICGQVGIAGSTTIGDGVVLGGSVGVADHVTIASGVRVGGRGGVTTSILEPGDYMGFPAIKASQWRRLQAHSRRVLGSTRGGKGGG